jgi:hypothetical protein
MRPVALLLLSLLFFAMPADGQTAEEQARLDWVQQRGRLLYEIDRAAWVTTDDLRARVPDLAASGIQGWTVERNGAGYSVIFYAGEGDARVAAYRARVENNRVAAAELIPPGSRPPLTPLQRRLADARNQIAGVEIRACAQLPLNLAVIPPDTPDGTVDVYVLTPQRQEGIFPFGGHTRVTLSANGEVLSHRAFTNSCINLSSRSEGSQQTAALSVSHLLDPIPTEIHVFLSIWIGLPLGVGTTQSGRIWMIENGRIELAGNI